MKVLLDQRPAAFIRAGTLGMLAAIVTHLVYNHFLLSPPLVVILMVAFMGLALLILFDRSEQATRGWLRQGLDSDFELLERIDTGRVFDTRVGPYLESLNQRFSVGMVADMLGLLRTNLEVSLIIKGRLMLASGGLRIKPDRTTFVKLEELRDYERRIGLAGMRVISPIMHLRRHSLWELHKATEPT
jgi:hypothetical protein